MEPDPDGRLVRRLQTRRTWDLTTFATKGQICTYLRLDHVDHGGPRRSSWAFWARLIGVLRGGVVRFARLQLFKITISPLRRANPASGPPRGVRGGPTRDGTGPSGPGLASWVCGAAPGAVWASGTVVMRRYGCDELRPGLCARPEKSETAFGSVRVTTVDPDAHLGRFGHV